MNDTAARRAATSPPAPPAGQAAIWARLTDSPVAFVALGVAAFALYGISAAILHGRSGTTHFGADTWFYAELAQGNIFERIATNYHLVRIARFHPTTVVMAAAWMQILYPLTLWIAPIYVLKAMFAAVGAVGAYAAATAFAAVVPRGYALLFGAIYALSFGVWYFASIEESKIVTASLAALYIATYLRLRTRWTMRGAVLLSAILLFACLNEIVSGFLIVIPIVDTLVRRGWDLREGRWIAAHALAGPLALVILELVISRPLATTGTHPEGASHLSMLVFYLLQNDYSPASLYAYVVNWLFFNIAAPASTATYAVPNWASYNGYFVPSLANYLTSPASAGVVALFAAIIAAIVLPRFRAAGAGGNGAAALIWALLAYAAVRGLFFIFFNPAEPLLFSPAVTLAHILPIAIPFAASTFPAKRALLAGFAVLLLVTNGAFMIGR